VPLDQAGMASAVTVVMRQAGFAVGIAVLGAVLHAEGSAIGYVWLFSVAAIASAAGLVAALALLPAQAVASPAQAVTFTRVAARPAVHPPSDG
jgi:cytochrome c-type biogenesis protein CcmH/NrfG